MGFNYVMIVLMLVCVVWNWKNGVGNSGFVCAEHMIAQRSSLEELMLILTLMLLIMKRTLSRLGLLALFIGFSFSSRFLFS